MQRPPSLRHRRPILVESLESRRLLAASAVGFGAASYSATQADGVVTFTLTRTGDDSTTETVDVTTSDGTAVAGVDYQQEQVTVTFAPGVNSRGGVVELDNAGASATPTKSFALNLSNPTGGLALGTPSTASVTIDEPAAVTPTTTTVAAGTNGGGIPVEGPVNLGAGVTFTAQVARTGLGIGAPTGTITFSVDGVAQSTTPLASNDGESAPFAAFTTSTLPIGQHTITAAYSGDSSATKSLGSTTVTVAQATTATLRQSAQTSAVGEPVTFTDYVQATDPAAGTPTGTVTFDLYGAAALRGETIVEVGRATLVPTATPGLAIATYTSSNLTVGEHDITAGYSGDATFAPQSSYNIEAIGYATTTAIGSSANPATPGQSVTLTAVVTASSAFAPLVAYNSQADGYVPATVVFTIDGVAQVPIALQASTTSSLQGTAQLNTGPLAAGVHAITAAFYDGSNIYNAQSQATLAIAAAMPIQPTNVGLGLYPSPATVGQPVTFTASVNATGTTPTTPTGTVTFTIDGVAQAPVAVVPSATSTLQAVANLTTSNLAAGTHSIGVSYSGDSVSAPATSASLTATVQAAAPAPSTLAILIQPASAILAASQPFLIVVAPQGAGGLAGTPTGSAELFDEGNAVGTLPLDAQGFAVFYLPALAVGPHQFTVVYGGDASYATSQASTGPLDAVDFTPPTVAGVARVGSPQAATSAVVVNFVGPLNPGPAAAVGNYRVTTAGGQQVRVKSAVYDGSAGSVTLHLAGRLAANATYRLRINGAAPAGVDGSNGQYLAGAGAGQAGTNYQGTIARSATAKARAHVAAATVAHHPQGHLAARHQVAAGARAAR